MTFILLADSEQNCTCELFITNQTRIQEVTFKRFGDYDSSHPNEIPCRLKIDFFHNADRFYSAECQMNIINRNISQDEKILIHSVTARGTLPENSGYCIEIGKEKRNTSEDPESASNENALHLRCGLNSEIVTSFISSALSVSATSSISTSSSISLPSHNETTPVESTLSVSASSISTSSSINSPSQKLEESTNLFIEPSTFTSTFTSVVDEISSNLTPQQVVIEVEDSKDITYVAIAASVSFLVISVVLVIVIFTCKTKRCHSKQLRLQTAEPSGNLSDECGQHNSVDCELQYNVLYDMTTHMDHRDEENPQRTNAVDDMSNEYKQSVINIECHYSAVDNMGSDYSSINTENVSRNLNDDKETPYYTVSEATNDHVLPTDEETTPTIDLHRSKDDNADSTEGISNNDVHVYAVSEKRKIEHISGPSGSVYAFVNK